MIKNIKGKKQHIKMFSTMQKLEEGQMGQLGGRGLRPVRGAGGLAQGKAHKYRAL